MFIIIYITYTLNKYIIKYTLNKYIIRIIYIKCTLYNESIIFKCYILFKWNLFKSICHNF